MKAMFGQDRKGYTVERELVLRIKGRDRQAAQRAIDDVLDDLPEGYRCVSYQVRPSRHSRKPGATPGRATTGTLVILHNSRHAPRLEPEAAVIRWKRFEDTAQ